MKRFISLLLAVLIVGLTFAGCSGKDDKKTTINSIEDLNGKKVAVQNDTTSDYFAQSLIDKKGMNFEILRYEKVIQCYDDLKLGRVDAILVDEVVAAAYQEESKVVWRNDEGEPIGICFKKDNNEFAKLIEQTIDTLYFDGTIAKIAAKYFGENVTDGLRKVTEKPELDLAKLKTVKEGKLRVGMEVGYPPMEYLAEDGMTPIGFDVEMSRAIAELLGLEFEVVNTAWDGIFAAVDKGEFDFVCSSVSITPDRLENYTLTKPYISNKIVLAVPKA